MSNACHFDMITAEIVRSGHFPSAEHGTSNRKDTKEVERLAKELGGLIKAAGKLSDIEAPDSNSLFWSLLSKTSWPSTNTKVPQLRGLCTVALMEKERASTTGKAILGLKHTMDLRFSIWLATNLWLKCASSDPDEAQGLDWWDMFPDQVVKPEIIYQGEMAKKISRLFDEDTRDLKDLGQYLTSCRALTNNMDASPAERVISSETKVMISTVLKVSESVETFVSS
jgi:hypothetical protein